MAYKVVNFPLFTTAEAYSVKVLQPVWGCFVHYRGVNQNMDLDFRGD